MYLQGIERENFTFSFYLAHFLSTSHWYRLRCLEMFSTVFSLWNFDKLHSIASFYFMTFLFTLLNVTLLLLHTAYSSPSWEAHRFPASQEIPCTTWIPKVYYRIHKCPKPVPKLSLLDPIYALMSQFPKIHLNIILPPTPGFSKWSLSLTFPHQISIPHMCHMSQQSYCLLFHHPQYTRWAVQISKQMWHLTKLK